ncbi:MAG: MFS transporter [Pseudomonadota bacterium]
MSLANAQGWRIVAAMLLIQTIVSGFGFYNMAVYITEYAKALQVPLAQVSFAVSLFFLSGGIAGMWIAKLLARIDVRWIMVVGAVVAGLSLSALVWATSVWQLYVIFTVFGFANAGVSLVVATTLINQWFPGRNRSIALSVSSTGLSIGGVLVTPLTAYYFNTHGLYAVMPWLGLIFIVCIVPLVLLIIRPAPAGIMAEAFKGRSEWRYEEAIRTRFYVLLALGYILCMGAQVGGIAHMYNRVEILADFATAATAVQILTVCSITGRILGGFIVTRIPIRWVTVFNLLLQSAGLAVIAYADSAAWAYLGAGMFGLSIGNLLMLQPLWLAEAFPGAVYARVYALANALSVLGVALGPFLLGMLFDIGGYTQAYLWAVALSLCAWVIILAAGTTPQQTEPDLDPAV